MTTFHNFTLKKKPVELHTLKKCQLCMYVCMYVCMCVSPPIEDSGIVIQN